MILKYGAYSFPDNEANIVAIEKRRQHNPRGYLSAYTERWTVRGIRKADTQAALTTSLLELEDALDDGFALGFYLDNGTTVTAHAMASSTLFGVLVKSIRYLAPDGANAEYSTFRTYEIEFEATTLETNANAVLVSFQETLTFRGGNPRFVYLQTLTGLPQRQRVAQATPFLAFQRGSAVQLGGFPRHPAPKWPAAEHQDQREIELTGPDVGRNFTGEFSVRWSYAFESHAALPGTPTVR